MQGVSLVYAPCYPVLGVCVVLHTPCYLTGEFLLHSLLFPFKCKLFPFDQFAHQTAVIATQPSVVLVLLRVHDGCVVMLEAICLERCCGDGCFVTVGALCM